MSRGPSCPRAARATRPRRTPQSRRASSGAGTTPRPPRQASPSSYENASRSADPYMKRGTPSMCGVSRRSSPSSVMAARVPAPRATRLCRTTTCGSIRRQPARRDVMVDLHRRDIHAAKTRGADAQQQFRHFLSEHEPPAARPRSARKPPTRVEHVAPHGHVGAERHLALLFVDERRGAVVLDRDRSPEIAAVEVEPRAAARFPRSGGPDRRYRRATCRTRESGAIAASSQPSATRTSSSVNARTVPSAASIPVFSALERPCRGLEQVAERNGKRRDVPLDDRARVVGRVVVDDDRRPSGAPGQPACARGRRRVSSSRARRGCRWRSGRSRRAIGRNAVRQVAQASTTSTVRAGSVGIEHLRTSATARSVAVPGS